MNRGYRFPVTTVFSVLALLVSVAPGALAAETAPHSIKWKSELFRVINFLIVVGVLWWLLKDRLPAFFTARRARIDQAIEEAKAAKAEAEAKRAEYEAKIAAVEQEIAAIEEERAGRVEAMRAELARAAEAAGERIEAEAEERIAAELNRAQAVLQREASLLAVDLAEELIKSQVGKKDQKKLFDSTIEKLEEIK